MNDTQIMKQKKNESMNECEYDTAAIIRHSKTMLLQQQTDIRQNNTNSFIRNPPINININSSTVRYSHQWSILGIRFALGVCHFKAPDRRGACHFLQKVHTKLDPRLCGGSST
jgi:hypothetical protein